MKESTQLQAVIATYDVAKQGLDEAAVKIKELRHETRGYEYSRDVINKVLETLQSKAIDQIEGVMSEALKMLMGDEYACKITQRTYRNKPTIHIELLDHGKTYDMIETTGDGVIEVIGLVLRLAVWKSSARPKAAEFILDEPFKHLSGQNAQVMMEFIKRFAKDNNIQFILTTHNPLISRYADKEFVLDAEAD